MRFDATRPRQLRGSPACGSSECHRRQLALRAEAAWLAFSALPERRQFARILDDLSIKALANVMEATGGDFRVAGTRASSISSTMPRMALRGSRGTGFGRQSFAQPPIKVGAARRQSDHFSPAAVAHCWKAVSYIGPERRSAALAASVVSVCQASAPDPGLRSVSSEQVDCCGGPPSRSSNAWTIWFLAAAGRPRNALSEPDHSRPRGVEHHRLIAKLAIAAEVIAVRHGG